MTSTLNYKHFVLLHRASSEAQENEDHLFLTTSYSQLATVFSTYASSLAAP